MLRIPLCQEVLLISQIATAFHKIRLPHIIFGLKRILLSGENLYHDSVSVIVPRFTSFVEDCVLCCCQVTILFCSLNRSLLVFAKVSMNTVLQFFVSTFEASPSESEFVLSEESASTAPPGPTDELWRAVTKQEGLALDLPCSSRLLVHGSPWPACHDLSASFSPACMLVTSSCYWIL